jgi:ABC-type transport system involved in multi-copper enzyme maturation permease subunit
VNPILSRELRARFRDKRSFWLLFGLAALLCLTAGWIYQDALNNAQLMEEYAQGISSSPNIFSTQRASATGRHLFTVLAYGNVIVWMLVAPALTATGLCKERERGLLESLWLSPFRVHSQIWGRFLASLLFLFELQLIATPVYGITLMLGGVSPQEILSAAAIIGGAAFSGAALGLWCSARAYRPSGAMGSALGTMILGTVVALYTVQIVYVVSNYFGVTWWATVSMYAGLIHPLYLLAALIDQNTYGSMFTGLDQKELLLYGLGGQFTISILLIVAATRKAAKPLPEAAWLGRNPYLEGFRRRLEKRQAQRTERHEKARVGEKVGGALLYEVPFEKLVRFRDPLLNREVRARFRLRQSGPAIALFRLVALFIVLVVWLFVIASLFDANALTHANTGVALINLLAGLGIAAAAILSSSSLTGERESGTLEGLKLSLMSPRHIVLAKWVSPLVTYACWSSLLWIWLPFCLQFGHHSGIALPAFLAALTTAIVALGVTGAWGLYLSSRAPHTAAATCWTLATLVFVLVGLPALDNALNVTPKISRAIFGIDPDLDGYTRRDHDFAKLVYAYHPFLTLDNELRETPSTYYTRYHGIQSDEQVTPTMLCVFNLMGGAALIALLLALTVRRVKKTET